MYNTDLLSMYTAYNVILHNLYLIKDIFVRSQMVVHLGQ